MDLLTVIMHEMGHVLGYGHEDHGVMQTTLSAGTRWGIDPHNLDGLFAILATEGDRVVN